MRNKILRANYKQITSEIYKYLQEDKTKNLIIR